MGIKFDHSQYALDADMALGASSNAITKAGPFTDQEFFRSLINPGFDGSLRYLMASCSASLTGSNAATSSLANKIAGLGADDSSIGSVAWTSPTNIYADDASYATALLTGTTVPVVSHYLKASTFGFSLPSNAVVTGIGLTIKAKSSSVMPVTISSMRLLKAGSPIGTEKSGVFVQSTVEDTITCISGAGDLWGTTWSKAEVEASGFGVLLSVTLPANFTTTTISINNVNLIVYYTIPSVASTVTYKWQARKIGQSWTDIASGSLSIANTGSIADDIIQDAVTTTFDAVPIDLRLIMSCADSISVTATIGNTGVKVRLIGEST